MTMLRLSHWIKTGLTAGALALTSAAALSLSSAQAQPVIGFSIDDLRVERWTKDRDIFADAIEELGADIIIQSANGSETAQISQIENLITQGVDAIVIVPFNGRVLSTAVEEAKDAGIQVISYARLIVDADIDFYVTFDSYRIGQLQAEEALKAAPKGNYFIVGGSQLDNNSALLANGARSILEPLVESGDINIVGQQWSKDWLPEEALKIAESALTSNGDDIQAFIAGNDGLAGAVAQAVENAGLTGDVVITGQDADLEGIRRINEGSQYMTVYSPIKDIATEAARIAVELANGVSPEELANTSTDNGLKDVPTLLLNSVPVTKDNIRETVIADGYHSEENIFGKSSSQ